MMLNILTFLVSSLVVVFSTRAPDLISLGLCMLVPLIYFGLWFLKTKTPLKDSFLIFLLLLIFLGADSLMINLGVFHYGLVALPPWQWPPVWAAALMFLMSVFIFKLPILKRSLTVSVALVGSILWGVFYFIFLERLDLLFLHKPKDVSYLIFFSTWTFIFLSSFNLKRQVQKQKS